MQKQGGMVSWWHGGVGVLMKTNFVEVGVESNLFSISWTTWSLSLCLSTRSCSILYESNFSVVSSLLEL